MDRKYKIAGIGELLWDLLPSGKQLGGAPCNFAYHTSQLGCEAYVVSSIGDDSLGKEIQQRVQRIGLDTSYIQVDTNHPTGTVEVELDSEGSPNYIINEGVAWDNIVWNESLSTLSKNMDAICFGSLAQRNIISYKSIMNFLEASSKNCLRVFDINIRQFFYSKDIVFKSLELANVLKLNETELPIVAEMIGCKTDDALVVLLRDFDLELIAYTRGGKGSTLITKGEISEIEVPKILVEDTVGAGDSFTAMLVTGLLRGLDIRTMHKRATSLSAYVCTQKGATPSLPEHLINF